MKSIKRETEEKGVKKQIKSNKGITLIALVITIIVLLILAGVTIAMLSGENGILSRATETKRANAEAQADEQAKLAYMGVRTEIIAERVANSSYNAQNNAGKIAKKVKKDLNGSNWRVKIGNINVETSSPSDNTPGSAITMTFTDSSLNNTNATDSHTIVYTIKLPGAGGTEVTLEKDGSLMSSGGNGGSGGSEQEEQATNPVVFKREGATVETPEVGDEVEIGAEKFKVIKKSGEGNKTITAMTNYNLDLTLPADQIKQQTTGDTAFDEGQTVAFSTASSPTWNANENITLGATESAITTAISNYETYLQGLGASNVIARIGRYYPTTQAGAKITEAEYIGNLSGQLNPRSGYFWLGSSFAGTANGVHNVDDNGNYFDDADDYGVRPIIIITIS